MWGGVFFQRCLKCFSHCPVGANNRTCARTYHSFHPTYDMFLNGQLFFLPLFARHAPFPSMIYVSYIFVGLFSLPDSSLIYISVLKFFLHKELFHGPLT